MRPTAPAAKWSVGPSFEGSFDWRPAGAWVHCQRCGRSLPARPGPHLYGPVSHVCVTLLGWKRVAHPAWLNGPEQEAMLEGVEL